MYHVKNASYLLSAAWKSQWPENDLPEIVLSGRSNVGKSSLINAITNYNGLAKVSSTPGKTRTLNFFDINHELRLVDVPGYGFAKVPQKLIEQFAETIDIYLRERDNLKGLILIVDYRHDPKSDDIDMYNYAKYYHIPVIVVATKMDKVKKSELYLKEERIKKVLDFDESDDFVRFSSLNKQGIDILWDKIIKLCQIDNEKSL